MSERTFVRLSPRRSWHVIRTPTRAFDTYLTLCGRRVFDTDPVDVLPGNEKTCERCAVIAVKADDRPESDATTADVTEFVDGPA